MAPSLKTMTRAAIIARLLQAEQLLGLMAADMSCNDPRQVSLQRSLRYLAQYRPEHPLLKELADAEAAAKEEQAQELQRLNPQPGNVDVRPTERQREWNPGVDNYFLAA